MTGSGQYLMLIFVLARIISISSAADVSDEPSFNNGVTAAQAPNAPRPALPVITFINDITPLQSVEVTVSERVGIPPTVLDTDVKVGADYEWRTPKNVNYSCFAFRPDYYEAIFQCYQPSRDSGRTTVYWLMNWKGIHLSWDKSKWSHVIDWTYSE